MGKNKRMLGALVAVVPLVLGVTGCHQHHHDSVSSVSRSGAHFTPSRDTGESSPVGDELLQKDKHALLNVKDPGACAPHSRPGSQCAPTKYYWEMGSSRDLTYFAALLIVLHRSQEYHRVHPEDYGKLPTSKEGKKAFHIVNTYISKLASTPAKDGSHLDYFKDKKAAVAHLIDELWKRSFNPESMWDLLDWSGEYGFTDISGLPGEINYGNLADYAAFPKYRRPHN